MKGKRYMAYLLMAMASLASCNESLKDTYSDYAGDGKIRYLAKCTGLFVSPGWERLSAEWKNGQDAVVKNIKVSWTVDDVKHDTLLEPSATSCNIKNLRENGTYRIDVCAVDENNNESLVETNYGKPYTFENEVVRSFTRAITKYFKVKDKLVFFMDKWNENLLEIKLFYTGTDGKEKVYPLTKEVFDKEIVELPGVDNEKPIFVTRLGKLEGCPDVIHFEPYVLGTERFLTADFKTALQLRYGLRDRTIEQKKELELFIDTVRVLEFDYDLVTLEDVLYCPKLEKIVIGKNRYFDVIDKTITGYSTLFEETRSLKVLDIANRLIGLKIERYNDHYFTEKRDYMQEMGSPVLPDLSYLSASLFEEIQSSIKDDIDHHSGLENLLDNRQDTWWQPKYSIDARTFVLSITLKSAQLVHGIKIAQVFYEADGDTKFYIPNQVKVEVSNDQLVWTDISHVTDYPLGQNSGEITLIPMANPREIKYVRVTVVDQSNAGVCNVRLADIILY